MSITQQALLFPVGPPKQPRTAGQRSSGSQLRLQHGARVARGLGLQARAQAAAQAGRQRHRHRVADLAVLVVHRAIETEGVREALRARPWRVTCAALLTQQAPPLNYRASHLHACHSHAGSACQQDVKLHARAGARLMGRWGPAPVHARTRAR